VIGLGRIYLIVPEKSRKVSCWYNKDMMMFGPSLNKAPDCGFPWKRFGDRRLGWLPKGAPSTRQLRRRTAMMS